jgi:hypothetical protein
MAGSFLGIEQRVTAGQQVAGTKPSNGLDAVLEAAKANTRVYAVSNDGGLFNWNEENPTRFGGDNDGWFGLQLCVVHSAAAFDVTLSISDGTITIPWQIYTGVASTLIVTDLLRIPPGWHLAISTAGASAQVNMIAFAEGLEGSEA